VAAAEAFSRAVFPRFDYADIGRAELPAVFRTVVSARRNDSVRVSVGRVGRPGRRRLGGPHFQLPQRSRLARITALRRIRRTHQIDT
jgi:hypothetical protein